MKIKNPGRPPTYITERQGGGFNIRQGSNLVRLSVIEADELIAFLRSKHLERRNGHHLDAATGCT